MIFSVVSYNDIKPPIAERKLEHGPARRCFRKVVKDVVVRRLSRNMECITVEIFVNILSIKSIIQRQFPDT